MRTLVIGDIHGGLKALQQCINRANVIPEDKLIFLGDYVDGWSESALVVQYLISLSQTNDCVFLRGNHDKWCENWLLLGQSPNNWVYQGGQSTIDSYVNTGFITEESHKSFFKNLRNYYIDYQGRGFVHGGFTSKKGLGYEEFEADYYWNRDLWQLSLLSHEINRNDPDGLPHGKRMYKHKEVFIGHTSTGNWNIKPTYPEYQDDRQGKNGRITIPMNRCNVWNLDTGGGFEGKITIMDIDSKEFWQSDYVKDLYPEEKGR